jgi:hypothetical protein
MDISKIETEYETYYRINGFWKYLIDGEYLDVIDQRTLNEIEMLYQTENVLPEIIDQLNVEDDLNF